MIIVRLLGGLGNQMFQYSFGRCVSIKCNVPLALDLNDLKIKHKRSDLMTDREYVLHYFPAVNPTIASDNQIEASRKENHYKERFFHFDRELYDSIQSGYLDGYWQSWKYFVDNANAIRNDFSFSGSIGSRLNQITLQMCSVNSVAVHLRRGDYVINANYSKYHGILGADYYRMAVNVIKKRFDKPFFYIFSDEPAEAKSIFDFIDDKYIVSEQTSAAVEDLYLMQNCKHHIIANSSFSWWGAWLSSHKNKIVCAPKKWFGDANHDTKDLVLENWICL